jgi:hypothetical protein
MELTGIVEESDVDIITRSIGIGCVEIIKKLFFMARG